MNIDNFRILADILSENYQVPAAEIRLDSRIREDLDLRVVDAGPLAAMAVLLDVDKAFGTALFDDETCDYATVGELLAHIETALYSPARPARIGPLRLVGED